MSTHQYQQGAHISVGLDPHKPRLRLSLSHHSTLIWLPLVMIIGIHIVGGLI
jgi:hypothetical protein